MKLTRFFLAFATLGLGGFEATFAIADVPGAYIGEFTSTCGDGTFGLLVTEDDKAVFLAFNASDRSVEQRDGLAVGFDGSVTFSGLFALGASVSGAFSRGAFEGTIDGACAGSIAGQKSPARGFLQNVGGYYSGNHQGTIAIEEIIGCTLCAGFACLLAPRACLETEFRVTGSYSGTVFVIVAADGRGYALFVSTNTSLALNTGGEISLTANLQIDCAPDLSSVDGCTLDGLPFSTECCTVSASGNIGGNIAPGIPAMTGSLDVSETEFGDSSFFSGLGRRTARKIGPFELLRLQPLPAPQPINFLTPILDLLLN